MVRIPGSEHVAKLARAILEMSLDEPMLDEPIGKLSLEAVASALFNQFNPQRDAALTGRLYPEEVSQQLISDDSVRPSAKPWFVQTQFKVRGRLRAVTVKASFLYPTFENLKSPTISSLRMGAIEATLSVKDLPISKEYPVELQANERVKLKAALQVEIEAEGDGYKVTARLMNTTNVSSIYKAKREVEYRSCHALYSPLIQAIIDGEIDEVITQDDPPHARLRLYNLNCFTRVSRRERNVVFAAPVIVIDRYAFSPLPADVSEEEDLYSRYEGLREVVEIIKRRENIEALHKHQLDSLRRLSQFLFEGSRATRVLVSTVPTAAGKTLTAAAMAVATAALAPGDGVKALLLFPTRVLTIQQVTAIAKYLFDLNQHREGRRITLGLYIGKGYIEKSEDQVANYHTHQLITECPRCGENESFDADQSSGVSVPKCKKCGIVLDYVFLDSRDTENFCPDIIVATPDKLIYELPGNEASHVLIGARFLRCSSCGRVALASGGAASCPNCKQPVAQAMQLKSDLRLVFIDEFTLFSGAPANRLSHFIRLLKSLRRFYGLEGGTLFYLACATAANPEEFACKLIGAGREAVEVLDGRRYFSKSSSLWQRVVAIYPWDVSTLGSISWSSLALYNYVKNLGGVYKSKYGKQLLYVQRKTDGHNLLEYVPKLASEPGIDINLPENELLFFHGDLSPDALAEMKRRAQQIVLGLLIATKTLGWGVHLPWLNVAHIWGAPTSSNEFFQVIGRVGRLAMAQEAPALVVLHFVPEMPRDSWIYENFVTWFNDPAFEPEVVEPCNTAAIEATLPRVFNALARSRYLTYGYQAGGWRQARRALHQTLMAKLGELTDELVGIYLTEECRMDAGLQESIKGIISDFLYDVGDRAARAQSGGSDVLTSEGWPSLRGGGRLVRLQPTSGLELLRMLRLGAELGEDEDIGGDGG